MIEIKEKGLNAARAWAAGLGHKVDEITWYAQVNTAERIRDRLTASIITDFDSPSAFVVGGVRTKLDKKEKTVKVAFKDSVDSTSGAIEHEGRLYSDVASVALIPHIQGGRRSDKGMEQWLKRTGQISRDEYLIPSRDAPGLDRYGNIKGSIATQILADLQAFHFEAGVRSTSRRDSMYMIGQVKGRRGLVRGIWKVQGGVGNASKGKWKLVFLITKNRPTYRKRWDFYGIGLREFNRTFQHEWDRVFDREIRKMQRTVG